MRAEFVRAAVVGSTGYGGIELVRLLHAHPRVGLASVMSSSQADAALSEAYPHVAGVADATLEAIDPARVRERADVVFLATPHGVSAQWAPKFAAEGLAVIDLSGDFRLKSAEAYRAYYGHEPADPVYVEKAVYGLPELFGQDIVEATFIANPGCYPTAAALAVAPLAAAGWIDPDSVIIDAKSGVSGAGRGLSLAVHFSEVNENVTAYKVNRHQHTPEIEQTIERLVGRPVAVTFTPHLVPMTRGILCTVYASLTERRTTEEAIELYRQYYEGRPFVRIRPPGRMPATKEVLGWNFCDIGLSVDARTCRVTVVSVIDNLVKGAAGQAVQNLNVMMGWDETEGLMFVPLYP